MCPCICADTTRTQHTQLSEERIHTHIEGEGEREGERETNARTHIHTHTTISSTINSDYVGKCIDKMCKTGGSRPCALYGMAPAFVCVRQKRAEKIYRIQNIYVRPAQFSSR